MKVGTVLPRMTISVKVGKIKSLATISIKTFVKVSIQNPTKINMKVGIVLPRMTISEKVGNQKS
jgi:hypothetical protein